MNQVTDPQSRGVTPGLYEEAPPERSKNIFFSLEVYKRVGHQSKIQIAGCRPRTADLKLLLTMQLTLTLISTPKTKPIYPSYGL